MCINLMPDRVDLSHVIAHGRARPEVLLCESYRKEGDDVTTLKRLRREFHLKRYRCTTLLRPGDYRILQVEAPSVPAAEMKTAIRWRIKDLIDFPVEAATVDAINIPQDDYTATRPQVLAVAARNELIAAMVKPFDDAGISLDVVDIPELAQRNVAHLLEQERRGLALLAFDARGGLLTFTCDGELYHHRRIELPVASLADKAEEPRRQLYDRIVLELQRSLDHFDRQFKNVAVSKVIVTPVLGAEDMQAFLGANLGVPMTMLDLSQTVDFPHIPELREPTHQTQCLQVIGAAMREEAAA